MCFLSTETHDKTNLENEIIKLRIVVLALGEIAAPPWWRTKIIKGIGLSFFERIYPRTYFLAAVNAAGKAARDVHDLSVGQVGVYHLFRLPAGLEINVHNCFYKLNKSLVNEIIRFCDNEHWLISKLSELCKGEAPKNLMPGATKIGKEHDCYNPETFKKIASLYLSAFENDKQIFPYFYNGDE